jgi:hypothetical protein
MTSEGADNHPRWGKHSVMVSVVIDTQGKGGASYQLRKLAHDLLLALVVVHALDLGLVLTHVLPGGGAQYQDGVARPKPPFQEPKLVLGELGPATIYLSVGFLAQVEPVDDVVVPSCLKPLTHPVVDRVTVWNPEVQVVVSMLAAKVTCKG